MLAPARALGQRHNLGLLVRPVSILERHRPTRSLLPSVSTMSPVSRVPGERVSATPQQPSASSANPQQLPFEGERVQETTPPAPVPSTIPRRSPTWTLVAWSCSTQSTLDPMTTQSFVSIPSAPAATRHATLAFPRPWRPARAESAPVPSATAFGRGAPLTAPRAPPAGRCTAGLGQRARLPVREKPLEPRTAGPPPLGLDAVSRRRHPRPASLARSLSGSPLDRENGTPRGSRVFWKKLLRA